jgi:hypothetical protein
MHEGFRVHQILPIRKMKKAANIHFENNMLIEKRGMNVYHGIERGAHFISHGSSVKVQLRTIEENDFISLSIVVGPGYMERPNVIDLPSWINYEFQADRKFSAIRSDDRIHLKIPAGLPEWKLKLTLPASHVKPSEGRVTISDDRE